MSGFGTAVLEAEILRTAPRKVRKISTILLVIPKELLGKRNYFEGQMLGTERTQLLFLYNAKLWLYLKKTIARIELFFKKIYI